MKKLTSVALATLGLVSFANAQATKEEVPAKKADAPAKPATDKLAVGSAAPAIAGATWVQGEEVSKLDKAGELYIVECWATWCGPCVAMIPHMNDLHKSYGDKGLTIVGMNVWEDGLDKVKGFVKEKGEGMSYRIAYSGGQKSTFADTWLTPSGTKGIPTAFAVKDGKIIYIGHPSDLEEDVVKQMMGKDFDAAKFAKEQEAKKEAEKAFHAKLRPLMQAQDWAAVKTLATTDPLTKGKDLGLRLLIHANTATNDWDALSALATEVKAGKFGEKATANSLVVTFLDAKTDDKVKAFATKLIPMLDTKALSESEDVMQRMGYARALFITGKAEESQKAITSVVAFINEKYKGNKGAEEFATKLASIIEKIKGGSFPPMSELR